jgi:hypothetical protein
MGGIVPKVGTRPAAAEIAAKRGGMRARSLGHAARRPRGVQGSAPPPQTSPWVLWGRPGRPRPRAWPGGGARARMPHPASPRGGCCPDSRWTALCGAPGRPTPRAAFGYVPPPRAGPLVPRARRVGAVRGARRARRPWAGRAAAARALCGRARAARAPGGRARWRPQSGRGRCAAAARPRSGHARADAAAPVRCPRALRRPTLTQSAHVLARPPGANLVPDARLLPASGVPVDSGHADASPCSPPDAKLVTDVRFLPASGGPVVNGNTETSTCGRPDASLVTGARRLPASGVPVVTGSAATRPCSPPATSLRRLAVPLMGGLPAVACASPHAGPAGHSACGRRACCGARPRQTASGLRGRRPRCPSTPFNSLRLPSTPGCGAHGPVASQAMAGCGSEHGAVHTTRGARLGVGGNGAGLEGRHARAGRGTG